MAVVGFHNLGIFSHSSYNNAYGKIPSLLCLGAYDTCLPRPELADIGLELLTYTRYSKILCNYRILTCHLLDTHLSHFSHFLILLFFFGYCSSDRRRGKEIRFLLYFRRSVWNFVVDFAG